MKKLIYLDCLDLESHQKIKKKNVEILLKAREDVLNNFKSNSFPIMSDTSPRESFMGETPKQMLQRLPTALAQIKTGNNQVDCLFFVSIKRNYQKSI